ncbi:hypothetical protein IWW57_001393 [Coemansia sp. S610]|nr:hypothetical protein IWW57_001393 [Coemansia sp. S610]
MSSNSNNNTGQDNAPPAPASPFAAAEGSDTDESTLIGVLSDAAASTPASDSSDAETIIVEPSPGETDEYPENDSFGGIQLYLLGTRFSEANTCLLGRNENAKSIKPFHGTNLSNVNEHLLAINPMDSGAASDAGGDSNAESSGFNELYNFMRTADSDSVLNPSPALPTAGPSTARPSTAVTRSSKRQRTGLASLANAAPLLDGSNGEILDEVVSARLSKILAHFTFAHTDVVEALYLRAYSYPLVPSDVAPVDFYARLARVADGNAWEPWLQDSGLTKGSSRAVLGSRLSYTLVMIGGMSADNMSGALLDIMFYEATNLRLHELRVITASEVKKMDSNEVCKLVKGWLQRVAGIVADDGLVTTLELADRCNNEYQSRCSVGSSSSDADRDGTIVLAVLEEGEPNADLFLGIEEDKLVVLYWSLPFLVGKDVSIGAMKAIRRISDGLFKRME